MPHKAFFFVAAEDISVSVASGQIEHLYLRDEEHHHLARVLRHRIGDEVWVTDGRGHMYRTTIQEILPQHTIVAVEEYLPNYGEPAFRLTLAQAILQLPRFEWLLEKGTEIGVAVFWPMFTHYSEMKPGAHKRERWQRIVRASTKQCGRSQLPEIREPQPTSQILADSAAFDYRLIAHMPAPANAKTWHPGQTKFIEDQSKNVRGLLLVGPEGGFADDEIAAAHAAGFTFLSLGNRRLRGETAGIAAATLVLAQGADF